MKILGYIDDWLTAWLNWQSGLPFFTQGTLVIGELCVIAFVLMYTYKFWRDPSST